PGRSSVRRPSAGPENLRKRFQRSLENVAGTHENAHERIPPQSGDDRSSGISPQTDGRLFLRRRRRPAAGFRPAKAKKLAVGYNGFPVKKKPAARFCGPSQSVPMRRNPIASSRLFPLIAASVVCAVCATPVAVRTLSAELVRTQRVYAVSL